MKLNSIFILILLFFFFTNVNAQYFNNANNELSYQLFEKKDKLGNYRVYIVIEDFLLSDFEQIQKWDSINLNQKMQLTENWVNEGKRIEIERYPYISFYPTFEKKISNPKLFPKYQ
jgi:hypothetical protein